MRGPTKPHGQPIRVDELQRRDQVLLFGRLVEIADAQMVRDFPPCVNLVIIPIGGGTPRETLVPRDMLLLGMKLPRTLQLRCAGCQALTPQHIDVTVGMCEQPLCVGCRARRAGPAGPWLTPTGRH
ncbi:hypothetical protein [Micromonospora sp. KC721]|uniref:hypothetical protein n=1 Tax=Micromonospora sp. KC721 TaxID=2530380 RepID=UPI00104F4AE4|nr:hypothetical protein [Micromonospora sp. KC721]TDB80943.1 hypothetical protein E1182_07010 [Micromonospora sp. KC721]